MVDVVGKHARVARQRTEFLDAVVRALPAETDEQNLQRVLGYAVRAFWRHLSAEDRAARVASLESMLRAGIDRARTPSSKAAWFGCIQGCCAHSRQCCSGSRRYGGAR